MAATPALSFPDLLDAYGHSHPPEMALTAETVSAAWQPRFRQAVDALRGPLPERAPLHVDCIASVKCPDHVRHTLRITVSRAGDLIAHLLVPSGLAPGERRPGLLVSHGHAKYGIDGVCGVRGMDEGDNADRAYALDAVRGGFVVIAPAWWGWHGRDGHADRSRNRDKCNVIQMAASMYGINVLNLHIQDAQAAVDVLTRRPEVDPERIGCLGNSYGGRTAMWFSIYDERIKVCVAAGCMNLFRERSLKLASCGIQFFPGILRYGDVGELFCLIAPRPLQLQAGRNDPLITPDDRDGIAAKVRAVYARLDAGRRLEVVLHDRGHILDWTAAKTFLETHL